MKKNIAGATAKCKDVGVRLQKRLPERSPFFREKILIERII